MSMYMSIPSWVRRETPPEPTEQEQELSKLFQDLLRLVASLERHFKNLKAITNHVKEDSKAVHKKLQPFGSLDDEETLRAGGRQDRGSKVGKRFMSFISNKGKSGGSGGSTDAQLVLNDLAVDRDEEGRSPDQRVVLGEQHGGSVRYLSDPTRQVQYEYDEEQWSQARAELAERMEGSLFRPRARQYQELLSVAGEFADNYQLLASSLEEKGGRCQRLALEIFACHEKLRNLLFQMKLLPKRKLPAADTGRHIQEDLEGKPVDFDDYVRTVGDLLSNMAHMEGCHREDFKHFQHRLRAAEEETERVRRELVAILRGKDEQIQSLNQHLNMFEQEKAKSQQTGSYLDSSASPPLLDDCVKNVRERLMRFCREYDAAHKEAGITYQLPEDDSDNIEVILNMRFARKVHKTKYTQAYAISTAMFRGFEVDGFDMNQGYFCPTLDLEKAQALAFKEFQDLKSKPTFEYIQELLGRKERISSEVRFVRFLDQKIATVTPLPLRHIHQQPGHPYFRSFCLFATWVWLLQRLALSFEPHARIFRVRSGAEFDPTYMVNVVDDDDEDEESAFLPEVGFMVVPGFRVGKIIIKSHVYQQLRTDET